MKILQFREISSILPFKLDSLHTLSCIREICMTGEREMCVNGRKSAVRDQLFRTVVVVNVSGAADRRTDGQEQV